jgi:hypothetical protein
MVYVLIVLAVVALLMNCYASADLSRVSYVPKRLPKPPR